jgi:CD109 antigen
LIQTDKAIYKAGDLMRFRLISINSETLPEAVVGAVVTIFDSGNLKIKVFSGVTFMKGKFEEALQLSLSPTLGTWKIRVEAEGEVRF